MLCIKEKHKECRDEFVLEEERINNEQRVGEVFDLQLQENNLQSEKKNIAKIINQRADEFNQRIRDLSKSFDILTQGNVEAIIEDPVAMRYFKKLYRISFDEQTKSHGMASIFDFDKEESNMILEHFKKETTSLFNDFLKRFEESPLEFAAGFKSAHFMCHKNISIKQKGNSISMTRVQGNSDFNYFSAIYKLPLKGSTKLQITIDGINSGDPYLDVGIMDSKKFKSFTSDPVVSFASETFSYCGTSQSGMSGSYSSAKFHKGFVFTMVFNQSSQRLAFTTKDDLVNLYKENLMKNEHYHFFLTLYHPEAACTIKFIK